jgi:formylglycine-generating enzyme required for sulfatase activity
MSLELSPTMVLGDVELILIPAGDFSMGSSRGAKDEAPLHKVYVDAFYIAKYPITNARYERFVEAIGHSPLPHWRGPTIPTEKEDYPVVNVTWYESCAYCQWLAEETGQVARLPTEAEWEKAARGTDMRLYPWGAQFDVDKCNVLDSGLRRPTPVGQYSPQGDSPYGVCEMSGNVWEWTHSIYKPYPYRADDGREDPEAEGPRVLRGGSFGSGRDFARVSSRFAYQPDEHSFYGDNGFRIVMISSRRVVS